VTPRPPDDISRLVDAARLGDAARVSDMVGKSPALIRGVDHNGWTALQVAAHFGHAEIVGFLLDAGAAIDAPSENTAGQNALHMSIGAGNADMVKLLLGRGADPMARLIREWTPLHQAALHGDVAIAELLLKAGAEVNAEAIDRRMPVDIALMNFDTETEEFLRGHGGRSFKEPWFIGPDDEDDPGWWRERFK